MHFGHARSLDTAATDNGNSKQTQVANVKCGLANPLGQVVQSAHKHTQCTISARLEALDNGMRSRRDSVHCTFHKWQRAGL